VGKTMTPRRNLVTTIIVAVYLQASQTDPVFPQEIVPNQIGAQPRTAKERLGSKAADEQRVDNCKVPLELRGSTPRPDNCADKASAISKR
jgi:DNA-binding transcriptional regulator PaaX